MRWHVIGQLVKKDFQSQRWMLFCVLMIPLILEFVLVWWSHRIAVWSPLGMTEDESGFTSIVAVVLFVLPYFAIFLVQLGRTYREAAAGYYSFMRLMPVSADELVTAKFITAFCISAGAGIWFELLWGMYEQISHLPSYSNIWGLLFVLGLFYPIYIAVNLAVFYRSGAQESSGMVIVVLLAMFAGQQNFGKVALNWMNTIVHTYPIIVSIGGAFILFSIWLVCWRWARITYNKYLKQGAPSQRNEMEVSS